MAFDVVFLLMYPNVIMRDRLSRQSVPAPHGHGSVVFVRVEELARIHYNQARDLSIVPNSSAIVEDVRDSLWALHVAGKN